MNIKTLRQSKKLSQNKLAQISGLAQSSISYIESGKKNPSILTIKKLSKALDVSIEQLINS